MECHFTYDPTFLVLRLFEVRYDKKYYDSHDVPLNTIFCDWITNKIDSLYDKFCNYMERKNQDTINTENIDNFVEEMFSKPTVMWNFWEELVFMVLIFVGVLLIAVVMGVVVEIADKIKRRKSRRG